MDVIFVAVDAGGWLGGLLDPAQQDAVTRLLGRLHPMVVHLPIGLILAAGLFELGAVVRRKPRSPVARHCLWLGAMGAIAAAFFGWLNAAVDPPGSGVAQTLLIHRWTGVALAIVVTLAAVMAAAARQVGGVSAGYRLLVLVAVGLVMVGGHFGSELVHGRAYVVDPLQDVVAAFRGEARAVASGDHGEREHDANEPLVDATPLDVSAVGSLVNQVQTILDTRCVHCHGPKRSKAGLRLDGLATAGPDHSVFDIIDRGSPGDSELLYRIELPPDDPDHMPADDGVLTPEEIETIGRWVRALATEPARVTVVRAAPKATPLIAPPVAPPVATPAPAPAVDAFGIPLALRDDTARGAALTRLRDRGAVAMSVAEDGAAVDVNLALVDPAATDADLARLAGLESSLVWLNLAGSAVTDDGVNGLVSFAHLERVRLERTDVGDAAIAVLAKLPRLRVLNLYGTKLTDEGLAELVHFPSLERVYVWQTAVTEEGLAAARANAPSLRIDAGTTIPVVTETVAAPEKVAPALPKCCVAATAAGRECDHPCCVAARGRGEICPTCPAE